MWNIRHIQSSLYLNSYHFDISCHGLLCGYFNSRMLFATQQGSVAQSHTGDTCRNPYKRIECQTLLSYQNSARPCHGGRMVVGMKLPYPLNIKHSDKHSDNATGLKVQYIRCCERPATDRMQHSSVMKQLMLSR